VIQLALIFKKHPQTPHLSNFLNSQVLQIFNLFACTSKGTRVQPEKPHLATEDIKELACFNIGGTCIGSSLSQAALTLELWW
jgi:hypothetical protein